MFLCGSESKITELMSHLQNMNEGNLSVSQYIGKAKNVGDHLAAEGEPVQSMDLLLYIVSGLGPSYNFFIVSVNMRETRPTIGVLQNLLERYDRMLSKQNIVDRNKVF